jgi:hypothetical protein
MIGFQNAVEGNSACNSCKAKCSFLSFIVPLQPRLSAIGCMVVGLCELVASTSFHCTSKQQLGHKLVNVHCHCFNVHLRVQCEWHSMRCFCEQAATGRCWAFKPMLDFAFVINHSKPDRSTTTDHRSSHFQMWRNV